MKAPSSVATVILLPPEREQDLLDLACEWTSAWLIRSALWVRTSDIVPDSGPLNEAPPRVSAVVLGRNGIATVGLFEELSRQEYDLVRFVAVRSVEHGSPANNQLDAAVRTLEDHLKVSKPTSTAIQFINVIVAPSRQGGASATHLIEPAWNINVIASPEDRRSPNSFDVFTRHSDPGPWAGFVLAHTVTAAGLWATIDLGPYDESEFDGFMEGTHVQRVAIRGVLTGALVVNVARQAMAMAVADESPLTDPLIAIDEQDLRVMPLADEERAISEAIEFTLRLGGGQLGYRPLPDPPEIARARIGFTSQAVEVFRFGVDKIKETPRWIARLFRRRVSTKVTSELHGDHGDAQVDVQRVLDWDDAELVDAVADINRQREAVVSELDAPVTARRHDIDGPLFESLRQSCFALLDGSEFPEGFILRGIQAEGNAAPVVASVSRVIPDWAHTWSPSEEVEEVLGSFAQVQGQPSHWLDVDFAAAWDDELSRRRDRLATRESELRRRLGDLQSKKQRNAETLEEAALACDALRDEISWIEEDLNDHQLTESLVAIPTGSPSAQHADESASSPATTPTKAQEYVLTPLAQAPVDGGEPPGQVSSDTTETLAFSEGLDDSVAAGRSEADEEAPLHVNEASLEQECDQQLDPSVPGTAIVEPDTRPSLSGKDTIEEELRESLNALRSDLTDASREELRLRRERDQLRAREARTSAALDGVDEQVALIQEARDSLRTWVSARSGSLAWRLLVRLGQEREKAARDFADLREAAETPIDPKVERPSQMRDRFMWRSVIALAVVSLAWITVVALKYWVPDLAQIAPAVNPVSWPVWISGLVALGAFITLWILFLISYYRENSHTRIQLRRASAHVEYLSRMSLAAREERQRLEALHRQVPDYLMYLSEAIHRPWTTPSVLSANRESGSQPQDTPETLVFGAARPRADMLPSFMRLAESTPGAGGDREVALVRDTVRSVLHRGWRYGALRDLLAAAEQAESLPPGTFDTTRLDRDPRLRAALMAALERSDARLIAGRQQLRLLAERIQKQVMDQIHPPVTDLAPDPLSELEIDADLLGESDWRVKEWDDFLAEALSLPSNWSTLAFSISGKSDGLEDVRAHGYGPERLVELKDESVSYVGIAEKSTRPVELVVRIDRTQTSRGPKSFQVFGDAAATTDTESAHRNGVDPDSSSSGGDVRRLEDMPQDYLA